MHLIFPCPRTDTYIHTQHRCADRVFFLPPPSSPHFPCRANEAADSTLYWRKISLASSTSICSPFPLPLTDLHPPSFRLVPSSYWFLDSEMTQMKCSIINCWHADSQNDGRTSHGWERGGGGGREDTKPKSRRWETLMCCDSLTELGHTYWKQSSNAEHHPPKPSRKPWTTGNRVIRVPRRRWKRVKWCGKTEMRIYFFF